LGVQIEDNAPISEEDKKKMFVDLPPDNEQEDDGQAKVSCYLEADADAEELKFKVENELSRLSEFVDVGKARVSLSISDEEDWRDKWKAYFKPFRLYDDIIIKPTWESLPQDYKPDDIVIEIDPGAAFGTGSHETTKLCIGQLKKYMKMGDRILDAGSGSGILSFVCNKLGASHVLGIDIDPMAVDVAKENRDVNHIDQSQVDFIYGNILEDEKLVASIGATYDVVVANILADVIIPLSAVVGHFMKPEGLFISSGIINIKEEEVRQALLDNNFDIIDTVYMNDWVSFVAKKR
jgi:ribosomal protein L11 methyltransferase